ncbi:histone-lysine N-methyltransferase PRDM9-like [Trichomycterus rosablanca]|uniref:histone-lysine N-methyltransferase PRDM9-like n=1 Tax=Trichomycterus rosablanca TaxID=2290929 RepID=UPI002F3562E0
MFCKDVKMETCMASDKETKISVKQTTYVDQQNRQKPVKEEPEDEEYLCGQTSSSVNYFTYVEQPDNLLLNTPVKEEEPEDEDYLYCEECRSFFVNECEVHGPALFIPDTIVPMGVADRARQTLPSGLKVLKSSIPNAGLGVFNEGETVPVGVHFGTYQGELVDREEAMNSGYSWVVFKSGQCVKYIDATRETHANWMRYVNCARNDEEHNLVAFQYQEGIFYRCCRPIQPGQELLVWYEKAYADDLGTTFNNLWRKKSSTEETKGFPCSLCVFSYTSEIYLHRHIKRFHHKEYVKLLKSGQIKYEDLLTPTSSSSSVSHDSSQRKMQKKIHHCSQCEWSFTQKSDLKRHQYIHTGEKPYHCLQCGKGFLYRSALQRHQRLHTGEKPYHCSQCRMSFARQDHLQSHQHIHTEIKPYQSLHSEISFIEEDDLQPHEEIPTGE